MVVHTHLIKFKLVKVCIRCDLAERLPGSWWRRKDMRAAAVLYENEITRERLDRLRRLGVNPSEFL